MRRDRPNFAGTIVFESMSFMNTAMSTNGGSRPLSAPSFFVDDP